MNWKLALTLQGSEEITGRPKTKSINTKLFVFWNLKVAISTAALRSSGYQRCRRLTVYFLERLKEKPGDPRSLLGSKKPKALVRRNLVPDHAGPNELRRELKNRNKDGQTWELAREILLQLIVGVWGGGGHCRCFSCC